MHYGMVFKALLSTVYKYNSYHHYQYTAWYVKLLPNVLYLNHRTGSTQTKLLYCNDNRDQSIILLSSTKTNIYTLLPPRQWYDKFYTNDMWDICCLRNKV